MLHRSLISSVILSLMLSALLLAGCEKDNTPATEQPVDAPAPQAAPAQEAPTPQHIASTPAQATIARNPPLDISSLLPLEALEQLIGNKPLRTEPLAGQPATSTYNALRIFAEDASENAYGVGLQVWKLSDLEEAQSRLNELKLQYLGVQDPPQNLKIAEDAFISERSGIRNYLFVAPPSHMIGISCESGLCSNWSTLVELGTSVQSKL